MNKAGLVAEVKKQLGVDCSKAHAERVVDAVLASITKGLQTDLEVQIVGFGAFEVKDREARTGSHPRTQEKIRIPATRTVGFRVGTTLRDSI
jgi:DNA-binding protein HU-beta